MMRRENGTGHIKYLDEPSRKKKWRAEFKDKYGKMRTKSFQTKKEAEQFLRDINNDVRKLEAAVKSGVTLAAFAPVFLAEKKKQGLKIRSYTTLAGHVGYVVNCLGHLKLQSIDNDIVQQMIYDMRDSYSSSVMSKCGQATVAILKLAAAKHLIPTMPVFNLIIPRNACQDGEHNAADNWLRENEMPAYEAECRRTYVPQKYTKHAGQEMLVHPTGYRLLFLLHTGIRLGEALALIWDDYDEKSKTLVINKNVVHTGQGKITQTPKTKSGMRIIILNRQALDDLMMLKRQFDLQSDEIRRLMEEEIRQAESMFSGQELKSEKEKIRARYSAIMEEHKYICGSSTYPYGSGSHGSTLQSHKKVCNAAGITRTVTVHGLRHTYVTLYYFHHKNDEDFDLYTFSKSIGHASIRTTMEIYAHLDMAENRNTERRVDDLKDF